MNKFRIDILVFVICICSVCVTRADEPDISNADLPNIVFIFADDLGFGDLACYGHPYAKTPVLDKLASEGTRYTQFYVSGITCCPSRTGFMTGLHTARFSRYPAGFGFGDETTITELLKKRGYRTGHFGKWHIGVETEGVYGIDTYDPGGGERSDPRGRDAGIFDNAIKFIRTESDKPFYINIWGHMTHYAVDAPDNLVDVFKNIRVDRRDFAPSMQHKFDECQSIGGDIHQSMREYLAEVYALDQCVGRVLSAIDELGIKDNTIIVFSSDHGPAPVLLGGNKESKEFSANMLGYAGEYRGGKHDQYEGGVRAPFIIRWPGKVRTNHVDDVNILSGLDWLPTLCSITGVQNVPSHIDGEDVSSAWLGLPFKRKSPLFWKTSSTKSPVSIRLDQWKFHERGKRTKNMELYNLHDDPFESKNIASQHPKTVKQLTLKIDKWKAQLPKSYKKLSKSEIRRLKN